MIKKKVFVAMSGGVDSSVAAALLKKRGFDVVGIHMRCYNVDGCAEQDVEDARRAAEVLGIPFYVFDFEKDYKNKVVNYMIDGYRKGITPNPDVMCNKEIKFGLFLKKSLEMGADYVATGHYVRLRRVISNSQLVIRNSKNQLPITHAYRQAGNYQLQVACDLNKDQSYFLWTLTQEQLKHCLFPIGEYTKPRVRALARKFGLFNADKKDSQGICFLGRVRLYDFLSKYIKPKVGQVRLALGDNSYKTIGEHRGAHFYTIGQRHVGIMNQESGIKGRGQIKPRYVVAKNIKTNTLVMASDGDPALYTKEIELTDVNLFNPIIHNSKFIIPVLARVRYRQPLVKAKLVISNQQLVNRKSKNQLPITNYQLLFSKPIKFVAPGQSAVFYRARRSLDGGGYELLGGGIIKS